MVLGAVANYAEATSKDPKNVLNYVGQLFMQTGRTAVDATFLRGMQSILMGVMDDTEDGRVAQRVVNRTATGLLPLAGAMRDVRNVVDPVLRDPIKPSDLRGGDEGAWYDMPKLDPLKEQVMASVPGLSQKLQPRLNATGEEIQRGSTVWPTRKTDDPIRGELFRLYRGGKEGYYRDPKGAATALLGKINTKIERHNKEKKDKVPLLKSVPRDLETAYAKQYGQESERRLTKLLQMPEFQALKSDDRKRQVIEKVKRDITQQLDKQYSEQWQRKAAR
jgi:hypothetical protein